MIFNNCLLCWFIDFYFFVLMIIIFYLIENYFCLKLKVFMFNVIGVILKVILSKGVVIMLMIIIKMFVKGLIFNI